MNDGHKRRHIRDIAHLYISGVRQRDPAPRVCLVMAGEDRRCFPGFHAANLAAALAARGCEVRVHERSGLLPNAGFYLALPPSRYIPWEEAEGEPGRGLHPGLSGVKVEFSPGSVGTAPGESPRTQVDVFHVPPLSDGKPVGELPSSRGGELGPLVIVVIAGGTGLPEEIPAVFWGSLVPDAILVFCTGESGVPLSAADVPPDRPPNGADPAEEDAKEAHRSLPEIGRAGDWETALADRVPVVVRDPDSGLASSYLAAADALRFKTEELRRTIVEPASAEGSPGLRSGSVDRRSGSERAVLPISRLGARHTR